jgi:hypothetical protein
VVLHFAAAPVLIFGGNRLAARLAGVEAPEAPKAAVTSAEMQYVAFTPLGLWAMLKSLGALAAAIPILFEDQPCSESGLVGGSTADWKYLIGPAVLFLAGGFLLFGAQALVNLLRGARNAGHPDSE